MMGIEKRFRLVFWLIAAGAILLLITYLSSQAASESNDLSKGFTKWLMDIFVGDYTAEALRQNNHFVRKAAHFTLYFCLGFSLTGALQHQNKVPKLPAAVLLGAAFAALDEFHQRFVAGRGPQVLDVLLDTCGVAVGSLLMFCILLLAGHTRRRGN